LSHIVRTVYAQGLVEQYPRGRVLPPIAQEETVVVVSRRALLEGTAALLVGLQAPAAVAQTSRQDTAVLNAWVRISADDRVTLLLSQAEIGQGISTTLPAILADELGADWSRVTVENSPVGPDYQNPRIHWMFTGNSESIQSFAPHLRRMGAAAREMLITAAATRWLANPADCSARDGAVTHGPSGRRLTFGDLAADAARLPAPANPRLRPVQETRIGSSIPRRDIPQKVDGSAVFGIDFKVDAMVYAAVRQAPQFGASAARFDAAQVTGMPGVIGVYPIPNGVGVVAEHFWQAKTALDRLDVTFADGPNAAVSSASVERQYRAALEGGPWNTIMDKGNAAAAIAAATDPIVREYGSPFQAHAALEPMNCTAAVTPDSCDVWGPIQGPELARIVASSVLKLPPERVRINWTYSGGGFGRRLLADFVAQAVVLSKAAARPVKVIWTREEDMTHDFYRPATLARLKAVVGADKRPAAIAATLVSATQLQPVTAAPLPDHVDPLATEGLEETRYEIPNFRLDYHKPKIGIPTSVLRTTGFGPNIFAIESFIDELAHLAGADPHGYRRALLANDARALKVLDLAAAKGHWGAPLPARHGRGIVVYEAFDAIMAHVVEVEVDGKKAVRVNRIVTVADPGVVYDPGIATSNLEGGVVWGLTSAMKSEMTFDKGAAVETNFDGYDMVHLWETAREVETHLIAGLGDKVGGIGEVGPVGIPPALANAIFAATGERLRAMPFARFGYTLA
jgi:isoquinoline 1-oxidoreductase subunit beta